MLLNQSSGQVFSAKAVQFGLGFFGFTVMLMGFFPCDSNCPRPPISRTGIAHGLFGLLGAVVLTGTMAYLGLTWQETPPAFTNYSLMTAIVSIFSLIILTIWQIPRW